jgi:nitrous oxidase accessory protein NosD
MLRTVIWKVSNLKCSPIHTPAGTVLRVENLEDRTVPTVLTVGSGEQYATIGAAIAAAPTGAEIDVYPGTYTEQLTDAKSLKLVAKPSKTGAVVIDAPATLTGNEAVIEITSTGAKLTGFTINATTNSTNASFGVLVDGGGSVTIANNTISGPLNPGITNTGIGVQVGYNGSAGAAKVNSNTISGYFGAGIVVDGTGGSASIDDNTITGLGTAAQGDPNVQYGVQVSNGASVRVEDNTISGNTTTGFVSGGSNPATVSAGIFFFKDSGAKSEATGNTVTGNDDGVLVEQSNGTGTGAIEIEDNHIHGNYAYAGIFALSSNNIEIEDNDVSANSTFNGIALNNSTGVQVVFNAVFNNASADGIYDFQGNGNIIFANASHSNGNNGINIDTTTNDQLWYNLTSGNTFSGIQITGGSDNLVALGISARNVLDGIRLVNTTGNNLVGNAIDANRENGINLNNADHTLIAFNLLVGNQSGAINSDSASTGTVEFANHTGNSCGDRGSDSGWTNSHFNDVFGQDGDSGDGVRGWQGDNDGWGSHD